MGHLGHTKNIYRKLVQKLDFYPIGIVEDEKTHKFLQALYTPEEAELISQMALTPAKVEEIAKKTGRPLEGLKEELERIGKKGLLFVVDRNNTTYYAPLWSVPGFIEMTLMKVREDIPQQELTQWVLEMMKDRVFVEEIFQQQTQFGKALVDGKVAQDTADVLPHEVATEVVRSAKKIAVSLCYCRHKEEHAGHPCQFPLESCLSLNEGATFVLRQNFGREIDREEALDLLEKTSEMGLMHIGDNVKNNLSFICNCCKCCCGILRAYHDHGIFNVAVASSFLMKIHADACVGCGRCAAKCPLEAIHVEGATGQRKAHIDQELCLGCGICYRFCNKSAMYLEKRAKKIITPESGLEKAIVMCIERGKLQNLMFDDVYSLSHAVLRKLFGSILKRSVVKDFLLRESSRNFMRKMLAQKLSASEYDFLLQ